MHVELRELALTDGREIFDMIKEVGPGENNFQNGGYGMEYADFPAYLERHVFFARGIDIPPQYVPQTMYWLYVDGRPVGIGKLRHYLNDNLRIHGGHIGYTIRTTARGKGYGTLILRELLKQGASQSDPRSPHHLHRNKYAVPQGAGGERLRVVPDQGRSLLLAEGTQRLIHWGNCRPLSKFQSHSRPPP